MRAIVRFVLRAITVVVAFSSFVLITLVFAVADQVIATARERARYPAPGKVVDVGGYRIHLRCTGYGSPIVILESGFGMTSNEWVLVQAEVSRFTRVCSYDRSGYGWSDRRPDQDAIQTLHGLLQRATAGPYVLVGHSYGSGLVRRFAYRYPGQVVGMVLAATSYPDEELLRQIAETTARDRYFFSLYAWSTRLGLLRFVSERSLPNILRFYFGLLRKYLPRDAAEIEIAFLHQTRHVGSMVAEAEHPTRREEQEDVAACRKGFGSIPLIVLSEKWVYSPAATEKERLEAATEAERQKKLAGLSSRGRQINLDCGHLIPLERPVAVIDAIREVVVGAR